MVLSAGAWITLRKGVNRRVACVAVVETEWLIGVVVAMKIPVLQMTRGWLGLSVMIYAGW